MFFLWKHFFFNNVFLCTCIIVLIFYRKTFSSLLSNIRSHVLCSLVSFIGLSHSFHTDLSFHYRPARPPLPPKIVYVHTWYGTKARLPATSAGRCWVPPTSPATSRPTGRPASHPPVTKVYQFSNNFQMSSGMNLTLRERCHWSLLILPHILVLPDHLPQVWFDVAFTC